MLTPYPQIVEYNEAVQNPATAFRDAELRQGRVKVNALGLPVALSGGFALTYRMAMSRRNLAVRCFHREIPAAQQKYALISRAMQATNSPYFVGFEYLPDGIRIRGGFYPVVKMDWVEGDPLGIWLEQHYDDRRALEKLREEFAALAAFLEARGIAHGDIQNGNVIISPGGLRLVDYDGVYVPGMPPAFGSEVGHKHFQHPHRTAAHFVPTIDRFSFAAVDLSLAALIEEPALHRRFRQGGETIVFRANDFADPAHSEVFAVLRQHPPLKRAAEKFAALCRADIEQLPSLADFRAGRNIPGASAGLSAVGAPQTGARAQANYIAPYPVLSGDDFETVGRCVGRRIEMIGQVQAVKHGIGERGHRRGRPGIFLFFGSGRGDGVRVAVWGADARKSPDDNWVGRWVSVVGLVEPPYEERSFWSRRTYVGISTDHLHDIDPISEDEARYRLHRGESIAVAGAAAATRAEAPAAPGGGNRRLVDRLLRPSAMLPGAASPSLAAPAAAPSPPPAVARPAARQRPARSNQDILRGMQPAAAVAPIRPAPPSATPRQKAAAYPARPLAAPPPSRAMPKTGSVVIHPRNRTPPPPLATPIASVPSEPTVFQRMLRFVGIDPSVS